MGLFRPSYGQGFATRDESEASEEWYRLQNLLVPGLGNTGDTVRGLGLSRNNGTRTGVATWVAQGIQTGPEASAGSIDCGQPSWLPTMTGFGGFVYAKPLVAAASWANEDTLFSNFSASTDYQILLRLDDASSGNLNVFLELDGGTVNNVYVIGRDLTREWHTFGAMWDGTTLWAVFDGQRNAGTLASGAIKSGNDENLLLGESPHAASDQFDGVIGIARFYDYAPPMGMVRNIVTDPYRLLRPRRRVFKAPAAVAGGRSRMLGGGLMVGGAV